MHEARGSNRGGEWVCQAVGLLAGVWSLHGSPAAAHGAMVLDAVFFLSLCGLSVAYASRAGGGPARAISRGACLLMYLQIYLVIGIAGLVDVIQSLAAGRGLESGLFHAAGASAGLGTPLQHLILFGLAPVVVLRVGTWTLHARSADQKRRRICPSR